MDMSLHTIIEIDYMHFFESIVPSGSRWINLVSPSLHVIEISMIFIQYEIILLIGCIMLRLIYAVRMHLLINRLCCIPIILLFGVTHTYHNQFAPLDACVWQKSNSNDRYSGKVLSTGCCYTMHFTPLIPPNALSIQYKLSFQAKQRAREVMLKS